MNPLNVNTLLLLVGLLLLLVNVVIGAIMLRQGRVRAGLLNILLALAACAVIVVGLVGISFAPPTTPAAAAAFVSNSGSGSNGAAGTNPQNGGTGRVSAIQTQIAQGTLPAPLQTSVAAGTPLSAAFANRTGNNGGNPSSGANNAGSSTGTLSGPIAGLPFNLLVQLVTVIGGIIIIGAALGLFLAERDHDNFNPSVSGGLLNIGAGVFVIVAAIVIPLIPAQLTGSTRVNAAAANAAVRLAARAAETATPTETLTPSATGTPMPSLTPAPSETPIVLVTQVAYAAGPNSTATACILTTRTLAYLRADASNKNASIASIFPGSLLQVTAQSTDKKWWRVIYTDNGTSIEGWVEDQLVSADAACNDGSVELVGPTATPTRTPRPSSTSLPTSDGSNTAATGKPAGTCTVTTTVAVSVRPDPSLKQPPVAQVPERTALLATEKSANGWFHVQYSSGGSTGNGWVGAGALFAEKACDTLTVVAAP